MLLIALILVTVAIAALIGRDLWSARAVPLLEPRHHPTTTPVSVIIPARNEAARIGRLLDGLARQTALNFEVIVIDDNSEDETAALVNARAERLPGLRVLTGAPLPSGWAGKCWACWQAAQAAEHPWLLFLDADTAVAPEMISTIVTRAEQAPRDFLTLLPVLELGSMAERVLMPAFVALIHAVFPFDLVNDPRSRLAMANGQCILIRRAVYFATGGHAAVRDSVLEDVSLARLVKHQGYRIEAAASTGLLWVRMYTNLSEVAEGLRKNAWAGYEAGGWRSAWGGIRQAFLAFVPSLLLLAGLLALVLDHPSAHLLLAFGLLQWALTAIYWCYGVAHLNRIHPAWGLLLPLGTLSYFVLAGLAWISIRRGEGIQWKGRTYDR